MARRTAKRAAIQWAEPDEVRDFAHGLSESALQCRELGHLWRPYTASFSTHEGVYHRSLRCSRCRTERVQVLSDKGTVLSNGYVYPDGYLHAGMGRIAGDARDVLRLESLQRSVNKPQRQPRKAS